MPNKTFRLVTIILISFLTVMSTSAISATLPEMSEYFMKQQINNANFLVELTLTIPALFVAIGSLLIGWLINITGRKPILIISLLLYSISGVVAFLLDDIILILISRSFLGIAIAGILVCATVLIGDYYTNKERGKIIGFQSMAMGLGGVFFLSGGGFLAEFGWRYPFLIYTIGLFVLPFVLLFINEPKKHNQDTEDITNIGDKKKLPRGIIIITTLLAFVCMVIFYLIPVKLPFYMENIENIKPSLIGIAMAINTLLGAIAPLFYGYLKSKFNFASIMIFSALLIFTGYLLISQYPEYFIIVMGMTICGSGFGLFMPNANVWILNETTLQNRGFCISIFTTGTFLGQFFSPIINKPISDNLGLSTNYLLASLVMLLISFCFIAYQVINKINAGKTFNRKIPNQ